MSLKNKLTLWSNQHKLLKPQLSLLKDNFVLIVKELINKTINKPKRIQIAVIEN